jgi:membrane protein implicated in regulation of membrane protease activity
MLIVDPTLSALGISAIITAIASLSVNSLGIQLLIWGILSIALAVIFRGLVPRESKDLLPSVEAEVSQTIPKGGLGEVSYEGSYWSARCQISDISVDKGQIVHVVGRQGNTLIVLPVSFPEEGEEDIFDRQR